jgi:hypothetical protein
MHALDCELYAIGDWPRHCPGPFIFQGSMISLRSSSMFCAPTHNFSRIASNARFRMSGLSKWRPMGVLTRSAICRPGRFAFFVDQLD